MDVSPHPKYSDYIVYVDESGDHSLLSIDPAYPLFVLSFCVFKKEYYSHVVTPAIRMLKFSTFGHDMAILHEQDIRKKTGSFKSLSKEPREAFLLALTNLIAQMDFTLITVVIDKYKLKIHEAASMHIYHLAMRLGLEKLYRFLQSCAQDNLLTYVICESRGRMEDRELETEFHQVCKQDNFLQKELSFKIIIADKKTNSEGLQFADMVARPVGLSVLYPGQPNRALKVLEKKFYQNAEGEKAGYGFHLFP